MRTSTDSKGLQLADEARLTAIGRLLRATSLDELPQLWNVVTGLVNGLKPVATRWVEPTAPVNMESNKYNSFGAGEY